MRPSNKQNWELEAPVRGYEIYTFAYILFLALRLPIYCFYRFNYILTIALGAKKVVIDYSISVWAGHGQLEILVCFEFGIFYNCNDEILTSIERHK